MKTERLYYHDSYLRSFTARVVGQSTRDDGRAEVLLDRSAFYPTSGGQPNDIGSLAGVRVLDVIDRGDEVVHVLARPLPTDVGEVVGEIDWDRRLDLAQQHTGQHILSQAFDRLLQAPTVSFHLGDETSTIDVRRAPLAAEEVAAAEALANRIVLENREIAVHFADAGDLERFALRKATDRDGEVRVVEIAGFDASACGGTHTRRAGEVGPIKVRRWERRGDDTRVEVVCGYRALRDYAFKHETVKTLAEGFRVRDRDVLATVERLVQENDARRKQNEDLRESLLGYEAAEMLAAATPLAGARLVVATREERAPDALKRLAQRLTAAGDVVALLGSTAGGKASLVFAQSPGRPFDMGKLLRESCAAFGGRGGGSRDLAQGGIPDPSRVDEALRQARDTLGV